MFFNQVVYASGGANKMDGAIDFGQFVYPPQFRAASAQLRQVNNIVHEWGANLNITNVTDRVYTAETYVRMRWVWFILPLVETAAAVVLLAVSIAATRRQPLLKYLALTLLFYGPGWNEWL